MTHDDTTPPFAGHGFACSEPFPLNAADRIAALERRTDELAAMSMRRRDLLDSARLWLRVLPNCSDLVGLIDAEIGQDVLSRIGGADAR